MATKKNNTPRKTQLQKDIEIRIEALRFAAGNNTNQFTMHASAVGLTGQRSSYNLVAEAKKIEKYIKTGE